MYVHSTSAFMCDPVSDIDILKNDLKNYTDIFFRRINKFILLSLLGVHKSVHARSIDKTAAVYLATENGNLGDTENVLHQIYEENSFPKPFNFINTMSNTASFYIAQSLKSLGRSITVSSKNLSFERGLELAQVDFTLNHITEALVGGVDEAITSRENFIRELDPSYHDIKLLEGSSWIYLKKEKEGSIGQIKRIKTFMSMNEAIEWVKKSEPVVSDAAFGILISPDEKTEWKKEINYTDEFRYISENGFYNTASAYGICRFFESGGKSLLHVNKNIYGQYVLIQCSRF